MYPHSSPPTPPATRQHPPPPPHSLLPPIRPPSRSPSPRKLTSPSPSSPPSNTSVAPAGTHNAQFATRSSPDHRFYLPHLNSHTQYPQSTPSLSPTPQPPPSNLPTNQSTTSFHDTSAIDYTPCSRHDIHYSPLLPYQLRILYVRVPQPIYKYSFLCLYILLFTLANISIANQPLSLNKYLCSNHLTPNLLTSPISNSFLLPRIALL
nr:hypothetical transcript [Hymenolepis microstoma]